MNKEKVELAIVFTTENLKYYYKDYDKIPFITDLIITRILEKYFNYRYVSFNKEEILTIEKEINDILKVSSYKTNISTITLNLAIENIIAFLEENVLDKLQQSVIVDNLNLYEIDSSIEIQDIVVMKLKLKERINGSIR